MSPAPFVLQKPLIEFLDLSQIRQKVISNEPHVILILICSQSADQCKLVAQQHLGHLRGHAQNIHHTIKQLPGGIVS